MLSNDKYLPGVSIILPTYNRANFIVETIESIRNQTYTEWELLVIDDASSDNTAELVRQIDDERVTLHKTPRLGMTGTRNAGIWKCRREFIAFIDSDDLWAPAKLQMQIDAFKKYPEAAFSLTGGYNFRMKNKPVEFFYSQREGERHGDLFISFFKSELAATTPSLMFKKQTIDVIGFFNESNPLPHVDFILSLAKNFKGVILYEPLLYRRLHETNISSEKWEKGYKEGLALIHAHKEQLPRQVVNNALFRLYINSGEACLQHGKRWKAFRNFMHAWMVRPLSLTSIKKLVKSVLYSKHRVAEVNP